MRKNNLKFGKQKNRLYGVSLGVTIVAFIITVAFVGVFTYTHINLNKYQVSIEAISTELETIQGQVEAMRQQEEEYKNELNLVTGELAKYQPIVIPDSMKNE